MNPETAPVVRVTRHFSFPAQRVFEAWLNPEFASRWLFATPTGKIVRAEVDARVGGRYTFVDRRGDEDVEHTGEYLEIEPPHRLVFTFGVPKSSKDFDRVTVEITPQGDGCELTLTQVMKPEWAEWTRRTQKGWTSILENMAASLGDPAAAANREYGTVVSANEVRFVRLLPGPIERVWSYLTEPEKRAQWFAGGPMDLRPGGAANLFFHHINLARDEKPPADYEEAHDPGVHFPCEVTQCESPRLLAFTWSQGSEVTFELQPQGANVELILTHRRLASTEQRLGISTGWHLHLTYLIARLTGATPPPFWLSHGMLEKDYQQRS